MTDTQPATGAGSWRRSILLFVGLLVCCGDINAQLISGTAGLKVWLTADEGISATDGQAITAWLDQSGNGIHATFNAANAYGEVPPVFDQSNEAVNGKSSVRFNNQNALEIDLEFLAGSDYTIFVVNGRDRPGPGNFYLSGTANAPNTNLILGYEQPDLLRQAHFANDLDAVVEKYNGTEVWSIDAFRFAATEGRAIFHNGNLISSDNNSITLSSFTGAALGHFRTFGDLFWFQGDIAEFVVFNRALTYEDIEDISSELAEKYALPIQTISGLDIVQDTVSLHPTWQKTLQVAAISDSSTVGISPARITWISANPAVAEVSPDGRIKAVQAGTTTLTASYSTFSDTVTVKVTNPVLAPVYEPVDPYLATPAQGAREVIPVVIMRFLPTEDGVNLDVSKASDFYTLNPMTLSDLKTRIDAFDQRIKFALEEGTKFRGYKNPSAQPFIGYKVVEYISVYEIYPPGPVNGYSGGHPVYLPDFHSIFERFNIEHYVNNLGVKEIWMWDSGFDSGYPSYDPKIHNPEDFRTNWESNMSSPFTGDISNSNRDNGDLPVYDHTYTVYGQNFRRTQAEAVHNRGHHYEALLLTRQ